MNTAEKAASGILERAAVAAAEKVKSQRRRERDAWDEAHSIPAGCGCTPFYSDAREQSEITKQMEKAFKQKFGKKLYDKMIAAANGEKL